MRVLLVFAVLLALPSALPAQSGRRHWIWISPDQIARLPASGPAWEQMRADANENLLSVNVGDQNDKSDSYIMAAALVHAKLKSLGDPAAESYRARVQQACLAAIGTESNASTALGPSRQVSPIVIAADLIDWDHAGEKAAFRAWVDAVRFRRFPDGRSITSTHEDRPNNWGNHAGASRLACALYVQDWDAAVRCKEVFAGYLGDRSSYAGFRYGDSSWQEDESNPVGINPAGATKDGYDLDGVLPDDQRRSGGFPSGWNDKTNYVYEGLQGVLAQAVMIDRGGYLPWNWSNRAILRAYEWLHFVHNQPVTDSINGSDDYWQTYLVNHIYGTRFPEPSSTNPGKAVGYTDWTTLDPQWP